jgi:hypothetical protein
MLRGQAAAFKMLAYIATVSRFYSVMVLLISQQPRLPFPPKPSPHPHSFTICLQYTDRHGTKRKHEMS